MSEANVGYEKIIVLISLTFIFVFMAIVKRFIVSSVCGPIK